VSGETEKAPEPFLRDYVATVDDVDQAGRWVVARVNTSGVDRFNTVIVPAGMDQREFEKNNRLVLWEHGKDPTRGRVPIGRSNWITFRRSRDDLLAKTTFAKDEFSQGLFELYRDNVLRAWSVNGNPSPSKERGSSGPPTAAELKARPDWAGAEKVYRSWSLTEYSGVAIAGNADALTEETSRSIAGALARGAWLPESLKAVASRLPQLPPPARPKLPPLRGRTLEDARADVERRSRETAQALMREAIQDARDIARGKV